MEPQTDPAESSDHGEANQEQFLQDFVGQRGMLHGFVLSLVSDYDLAEEVFQEVSIVLWRKYHKYEVGTNFGAWARAVAYREVLSARRKSARGRSLILCEDEIMERILDAYQRADLAEQEVDTDRLTALRSCMDQLGDSSKEILDMRYEQRLPSRQIAETLNRTVSAIDVALHRIRSRLAKCVEVRLVPGGAE